MADHDSIRDFVIRETFRTGLSHQAIEGPDGWIVRRLEEDGQVSTVPLPTSVTKPRPWWKFWG